MAGSNGNFRDDAHDWFHFHGTYRGYHPLRNTDFTEAQILLFDSLNDEHIYIASDTGNCYESVNGLPVPCGGGTGGVLGYTFSTSTVAADPGIGFFRYDNSTLASVTNIYVSETNNAGLDMNPLLGAIATTDKIYIQSADDASESVIFNVTGPGTDNGTWWTIPVTVASSNTLHSNGDICVWNIAYLGATPGAGGIYNGNGTVLTTTTATLTDWFEFNYGVSDFFRFDGANGRFGINVVPSFTLDVLDTNAAINLESSTGSANIYMTSSIGDSNFWLNGGNSYFYNSASLFYFYSTGNDASLYVADTTSGTQNAILTAHDLTLEDSAGATQVFLNADGDSYFTGGNLGIGTALPTSDLHIDSSGTNSLQIDYLGGRQLTLRNEFELGLKRATAFNRVELNYRSGTTAGLWIGTGAAATNSYFRGDGSDVHIGTNSLDRVTVLSTGEVGVGTSSPTHLLTLERTDTGTSFSSNGMFKLNNTSSAANTGSLLLFSSAGVATARIRGYTDGVSGGGLQLSTVSSAGTALERVRILPDGNVGIGTNSPNYKLEVSGTSGTVGVGVTGITTANDTAYWSSGTVTGNAYQMTGSWTVSGNLVDNLQNIGTGNAFQSINVANGGGDAYTAWTVNTVGTWIAGIDNSLSDIFRLGYFNNPSSSTAGMNITTSHEFGFGNNGLTNRRLSVFGPGTTSATVAIESRNSSGTSMFKNYDNGLIEYGVYGIGTFNSGTSAYYPVFDASGIFRERTAADLWTELSTGGVTWVDDQIIVPNGGALVQEPQFTYTTSGGGVKIIADTYGSPLVITDSGNTYNHINISYDGNLNFNGAYFFGHSGAIDTHHTGTGRGISQRFSISNIWYAGGFNIKRDGTNTFAGTSQLFDLSGDITAASSTHNFHYASIRPTVNQAGTATGDIIGLYLNPTLTAVTGTYYSIYSDEGDVVFDNGNVGIGITPTTNLHISDDAGAGTGANSSQMVLINNENVAATFGTAAIAFTIDGNNTGFIQGQEHGGLGYGKLHLGAYGSDLTWTRVMTLDYNYNVGIGTTSPSGKLHVDGNGSNIIFYMDSGGAANHSDIYFTNSANRQRIRLEGTSNDLILTSLNGGANEGVRIDYTTGAVYINGPSGGATTNVELQVNNALRFGDNTIGNDAPVIWNFSGTAISSGSSAGRGLGFFSNYDNDTGTNAHFGFTGAVLTPTSGEARDIYQVRSFNPTSGTARYFSLYIRPQINQTGGANGITRAVYIQPVITAADDFRALDIETGAIHKPVTTVTSTTYTAAHDYVILVDDDTAGAAVTINLPVAAKVARREYKIKKLGTTGNVIINPNGTENLEGTSTSHTMTTQYDVVTIVCDGTAWWIVGN